MLKKNVKVLVDIETFYQLNRINNIRRSSYLEFDTKYKDKLSRRKNFKPNKVFSDIDKSLKYFNLGFEESIHHILCDNEYYFSNKTFDFLCDLASSHGYDLSSQAFKEFLSFNKKTSASTMFSDFFKGLFDYEYYKQKEIRNKYMNLVFL